jgi:hypothetical protein
MIGLNDAWLATVYGRLTITCIVLNIRHRVLQQGYTVIALQMAKCIDSNSDYFHSQRRSDVSVYQFWW